MKIREVADKTLNELLENMMPSLRQGLAGLTKKKKGPKKKGPRMGVSPKSDSPE